MKKNVRFFPGIIFAVITVVLFSCCEDEKIPLSNEKEILSFKINGEWGVVNNHTMRADLLLPEGTDISNVTPQITISNKAVITPASGVPQDFSAGAILYVVTAEDGTTQDYTIAVQVKVLQYKVGDFYPNPGDPSTAIGVVFQISGTPSGTHGKIVSIDECRGIAWSTEHVETECNSKSDGKLNTDWIKANKDLDNYPAFKWCIEKGEGWYLPSYDEVSFWNRGIMKLLLNEALVQIPGASKLWNPDQTYFYWTSIEGLFYSGAIGVRDNDSFMEISKKTTGPIGGSPLTPSVRAVLAF